MQYDPIKKAIGNVVGQKVFARTMFYRLLDLLLLRTWHVKRELKKYASGKSQPLHVLDAGFGFGQYAYWMAKKNPNWKITGIDIKSEQVTDCNSFFTKAGIPNAVFETADLTKYNQPNTFDLIISVDVMEHIADDDAVFRNFHNSLKTGGMMLISTPSDQGGSDVHNDHQTSFIEEHVRDGYNIDDIRQKLLNAGFIRTEERYQYGKPGKLSWKLSMKYPIKILGVSKLFFIILPFYYLLVFPFCMILNYADIRIIHRSGTGLIVKAWK